MKSRLLILPLALLLMSNFLLAQERRINVVKKGGNRFALVIGNSAYKNAKLTNPENDAVDMAQVLKGCGFDVILEINADLETMEKALNRFCAELQRSGIGLFYFAGHGMRVDAINYLIPVGSNIRSVSEIKPRSLSVDLVLGKMGESNNDMNILILDACRDNPFAMSFRSYSAGLASMAAPKGTLIVYATGPGKTAEDGRGRNGVFTGHLLKTIKESNVGIMRLLQEVRKGVVEETKEKQIPWESSSLIGDFYFDYKDERLDHLKIEISRLQSQLRELETRAQQVTSEKKRRDAEQEAQETAAQETAALLETKKREREWLEKEQQRRERLKQEGQLLAQKEAQRRKAKEQQMRLEEERLKALRDKFRKEKEKLDNMSPYTMTPEEAKKEVAALEKKIEEIENQVEQEKESAIQKLKRNYQPVRDRLYQPIPSKDQFEKTTTYNARVQAHKDKIQTMEEEYKIDLAEIGDRYKEEKELRRKIYDERIIALKSRKYPVNGLSLKLSSYDADFERCEIEINLPSGEALRYYLSIAPDKARHLYRNQDLLKVEGYYADWNTDNELSLISIIMAEHEKLRVYYRLLSKNDIDKMNGICYEYLSHPIALKRTKFTYYSQTKTPLSKKVSDFLSKRYIKSDEVVTDWERGLMWNVRCSSLLNFKDANQWIADLNKNKFGGYNDWRLPTLNEAVSLMESFKKDPQLIEGMFVKIGYFFWSGDMLSGERILYDGTIVPIDDKSYFVFNIIKESGGEILNHERAHTLTVREFRNDWKRIPSTPAPVPLHSSKSSAAKKHSKSQAG